MLHELTPHQFAGVRPLFAGFDYSLSLQAAIEGVNPGRIFVDDVENPRTGLALTVEGYLLAGEHDDPEILEALHQFLSDSVFTGKVYVNGADSLSLAVHPEAWEARLPELIPDYEALKLQGTIDRFSVKCDAENNLPATVQARELHLGLAIKLKQVEYMSAHLGNTYAGVITGAEYEELQTAFFDLLHINGIHPDGALARCGQARPTTSSRTASATT